MTKSKSRKRRKKESVDPYFDKMWREAQKVRARARRRAFADGVTTEVGYVKWLIAFARAAGVGK